MEKKVLNIDQLAKTPMFIASLNYHTASGGFYIKVKDAVSDNPLFATSSNATGTIWLTIRGGSDMLPEVERQLKEVYDTDKLIGTEVPKKHATWGENVPATEHGEELTGVYDVTVH